MISEVYNIDCMEYMRRLPDKHFDLAIADPPFGISAKSVEPWKQSVLNPRGKKLRNRLNAEACKKNSTSQKTNSDFDYSPPSEDFFIELFRISKNQIIWGGNYFNLPPTRCILCWNKKQPWPNFSQFEIAWTSFNSPALMFDYRNNGYKEQGSIHPTQKPISLYGWLLKNFAKQGQTIFDPMMGSQSSRIAAYRMGFDYYGCELDSEYFRTGSERFERMCMGVAEKTENYTIVQTKLF